MVRALLIRGMIAGLVAGLLAVGFAEIFGEPPLDKAIAFEAAAEHVKVGHAMAGHEMTAGPELVSRAIQGTAGLTTAGVTYGIGLGGLFALVFAFAYGRGGPVAPRELALLLAGLGFVAIVLVPQLKYPANPPSIGVPDTIGARTALYFEMIAISLAALTLAFLFVRRFGARLGNWNGTLLAAGLFIGVTGIAAAILPDVNEVPAAFPAIVLWRFRVAALGTQIVLWGSLGIVFGLLAEPALNGRAATMRRVRPGRSTT